MPETPPPERLQNFDFLFAIARDAPPQTVRFTTQYDPDYFQAWHELDRPHHLSDTYFYWSSLRPDVVEPTFRNKPGEGGQLASSRSMDVSDIVNSFMKKGKEPSEIAHYIGSYITWVAQTGKTNKIHTLAFTLLEGCLGVGKENLLLQPSSPVIEVFAQTAPNPFPGKVAEVIGKLLLRQEGLHTKKFKPNYLEELPAMVRVLDSIDSIPTNFWYTMGIKTGLVFHSPDVLEVALNRLSSTEGMEMLRAQKIDNPFILIRDYINNLLATYIADPRRDQKSLLEIQKTIETPLGGTILGRVISIGQGVTRELNQAFIDNFGAEPEDLLPDLDYTRTVQVGEALFRILERRRYTNLPSEVAIAQRAEDTMHTALIELLHAVLIKNEGVPRNRQSLRLRFGDDTERLMDALPEEQFPISVSGYFRRKYRNQSSPVRLHKDHIKKPGGGLLS